MIIDATIVVVVGVVSVVEVEVGLSEGFQSGLVCSVAPDCSDLISDERGETEHDEDGSSNCTEDGDCDCR